MIMRKTKKLRPVLGKIKSAKLGVRATVSWIETRSFLMIDAHLNYNLNLWRDYFQLRIIILEI